MPVVVGLGNPGPRYAGTRHNVGFGVVERLAARWAAPPQPATREYRWWRARRHGHEVALLEPLTFMNASGEALLAWRDRQDLDLDLEGLMVMADDVYLPLGMVRLRPSGSSGGHQGLESIEAALGGRDYARLRIGVGAAPSSAELGDHVLEKFTDDEEQAVARALDQAAEAVECWLELGMPAAMNRYNRRASEEAKES